MQSLCAKRPVAIRGSESVNARPWVFWLCSAYIAGWHFPQNALVITSCRWVLRLGFRVHSEPAATFLPGVT